MNEQLELVLNVIPRHPYHGLMEIPEELWEDHKSKFIHLNFDGKTVFPFNAIPLNRGEKVYAFVKKIETV
jgi:hypothetical protein